MRVFGNAIKNSIINMYMTNDEQNHLKKYIKEFKTKTKPQNNSNLKKAKEYVLDSAMALLKRGQMVFKAFCETFLKPENQNKQKNQINQAAMINILH